MERLLLRLKLLVLVFGNLFVIDAWSQNANIRFHHITSDNGLSQNTVVSILQDSRGFMWFGTWNGLNRYDGYNFVVYKSDGHDLGLSNNFIYSICEDKNGDIWIGTKNGLNKFEYSTNRFTHYFHDPNDPNSISDNWIKSLHCDSIGMLWAGTASNGLNVLKIDPNSSENLQVTHLMYDPDKPSIPDNHINCIYEDKGKNIWVGTDRGVVKITDLKDFKTYQNQSSVFTSLSYNIISSVFEDRNGNLWVGTHYGLNRYHKQSDNFTRYYYDPVDPRSLSHSFINDISEDPEGNVLIGTLGGLNKYDPSTNDFMRFPYDQNDSYSLNNEFINIIYTDNQGNIWIGTDKGGVSRYNIDQKQFGYLVHEPIVDNSLSHNTINSLLDEPTILWIGTAGGGLNRYDKNQNMFKFYKHLPQDDKGLNNDFITSVHRDNKQNLWIGTWGGGLNKAISLTGNGTFKKYLPIGGDPNSLCNVYISSVFEDENDALLIGTLGGLDLLDLNTEKFYHIADNPEWNNKITEVGCILKDKEGYYWIGTRLGLFRFHSDKIKNLADSDIEFYINHPNDKESLPGNYVISLHEDKSGKIWVGTYGSGLAGVKQEKNGQIKFERYTEEDGLSNNVVYAILEDDHHHLWLSTDYGLSKFDIKESKFKNYYVTDGLQSNQFYWSAAFKNKDGKMYFGGMKGVNFFHPDSIRDVSYLPNVVFTDFKIFNNSVNTGLWNNKKVILEKAINETKQIKISHKENVFSIEFSALSYFLPEKIKYAYQMVGVDYDWVEVPATRRFASYTNLKGGEYTFLVKASNSDGVWNDTPTQLKVIITPPFSATPLFKILLTLFIGVFAITLYAVRTRSLRHQKRKLEVLVKERTAKIEEQKEELEYQADQLIHTNHQLENRQQLIEGQKAQLELQNKEISEQRDKLIELNKRVQLVHQLKLRFFTNISHEFRTPLTLILGPLEQLLKTWKGEEYTRNTLQLINRNAQRLLHLINQLMEFRKIETGKLELKVSKGNVTEFIEGLYSMFRQLADQRHIDYSFHSEKNDAEQWFDHEKLENIVFNLLSNAFKFTPEHGKISLSVTYLHSESDEKLVRIKVSDTGIGISPEHQADIFKRFYQVNTPENFRQRGSGIGLSLAKELVKAHHGHIALESVLGVGSTFTVRIPYSHSSFTEKEMVKEPVQDVFSRNLKGNFGDQILNISEVSNGNSRIHHQTVEASDVKTDKPIVLVVEDNYDLRTFITAFLSNDYHVIESENGKEAYEKAKILNPRLIISDIMMPEMDGLELCSRIKSNILTSHIPVILLTSKSSVENWIEGLETGADDYIPKPFNIIILEARIKNLIESRDRLKRLFRQDLTSEPSQITSNSVDEQFLCKAIKVVEENFMDSEFGVENFIEKMGVSRSLLHKKLSAITDQSAGDFITSMRLKKSAHLLKAKSGNISEIAYDVGFNDPKYFSRLFKKTFGVSPSEFVQIKQEN